MADPDPTALRAVLIGRRLQTLVPGTVIGEIPVGGIPDGLLAQAVEK